MIEDRLLEILSRIPEGVKLVAVSKFHPFGDILQAYQAGQRIFGENRPQELAAKAVQLPPDIEWHFIGHLQTNKLKLVLPYASMVQSVDSLHLLDAINDWGERNARTTRVLLELHIGAELSKQGFLEDEILSVLDRAGEYPKIGFCGLMGMASHTDDEDVVRADFARIKNFFDRIRCDYPHLDSFAELSIGMSDDWHLALEYGATMVRIGTAIFGPRL